MELHRPGAKADWQSIPLRERSLLQRVAAATRGYITPANLITILGLAVVLYGGVAVYQDHYWLGFVCIFVGRLADLLDGWVADATRTKNRVGEFVDAAADKVATLGLLSLFYASHLTAWWVLTLLLLPQVIILLLPFWSIIKHFKLHVSPMGKYAMAGVWLVLGGMVLAHALRLSHPAFVVLDCLALVVSVAGFYVVLGYFKRWD